MMKTTKLRDAISFAIAVGATGLMGTGAAFAQDAQQNDAQNIDRIEVTGSRIRRADTETTSPVLSISRQQLEQSGLTSVGDVLFNITASDGGALRNITTSTNGSDGTQNVSLRSLGAGRTLVLVNGRRWVTQGDNTVDLNTIPMSVVERVEVLKDGASAIYGSDAIAGVINVITRKNFEGAEANVYMGSYTKQDGFQQAYDFTLGSNNDRLNTVFSISYTDQSPVYMGDRSHTNVPILGGGDIASGGAFGSGSTIRGNFVRCAAAPTATPSGFTSCAAAGGAQTLNQGASGRSPADFRPFRSFTTDGSGSSDRYNYAPVNYLLQPISRFNVYGQGTLRLTDSINANIMATYVKRTSNQQLAEVPLTMDIRGSSGPQWAFAPSRQSVFNPFGQDIRTFNFRARAVGPRNPHYTDENVAVTGWLDGSFELLGRNMYWDAGYSFLNNRPSVRGFGYINLFNLRRAVGPSRRNPTTGALECLDAAGAVITGCVPYNVFGGEDLGLAAGVISRAEYDAMNKYISYVQSWTAETKTHDYFANLSGDIVDLPAGPLGFAMGVESRRQTYYYQPDALVAGGGSSDNYSEPTQGRMGIREFYGELNIPVLANMPGFKNLEINLAARRSDYTASGLFNGRPVSADIGGNTSRKLGIKWQVFDDLMFRGTYSESFRAPNITDLFSGGGEGFPQASDPCNTVNFTDLPAAGKALCVSQGVPAGGLMQPNPQIRSLGGGNPNLKPEYGKTRTLGVVYSPGFVPGLDITLDWYDITLNDALSTQGAQSVLTRCYRYNDPLFCSFIKRDNTGQIIDLRTARFNLSSYHVEGYDLSLNYRLPDTAWGRFVFQWDSTYQSTVESKTDPTSDWVQYVGQYNGSPNWRLRSNLAMQWQRGNWDASVTARYYSRMVEDCQDYAGYFDAGISPTQLCTQPVRVIADPNTPGGSMNAARNHIGATTFFDAQVGVKLPWNGRVAIGGRNIFGRNPPTVRNSFAGSFDGSYDLPGGGFYYIQYKQKF